MGVLEDCTQKKGVIKCAFQKDYSLEIIQKDNSKIKMEGTRKWEQEEEQSKSREPGREMTTMV